MADIVSGLSFGPAGVLATVAVEKIAPTTGFTPPRVDIASLIAPSVGLRGDKPETPPDLADRIRAASGSLSTSRAFAEAVLDVETRLAGPGPQVHEQLAELFQRIREVAGQPTDSTTRDAVVTAARDLVEGIRRRAAALDAATAALDQRVRENAQTATAVMQQLADTNTAIGRGEDLTARRDQLATELADLVGGSARVRDGQMMFVLDDGTVLVDRGHAAKLVAVNNTNTETTSLEVVTDDTHRDVTAAIGGGSIGAGLAARDGMVARVATELDQLASDLALAFNGVHSANAGLDGATGRPAFGALGAITGAAGEIALDPGLARNSAQLATSIPGAGPRNNGGALAMLELAAAPVAAGGRSLIDAAADMAGGVGARAADARATIARDTLVADNLVGLRNSLADVDIKGERTNLARFEHASSATTRFVSSIDNLLGDLIDRL